MRYSAISTGARLGPAVVAWAVALAAEMHASEFMAGADISSLVVHENNGAIYKDYGQTQPGDLIEILSSHGVNWYRLRLFVDPQMQNNWNGGFDAFVVQDLEYTIALAQRVKAAGGKVLLDFHYSDTWADPGHQWKPDAWRSIPTLQGLADQVYSYTKETIEAFNAAGVPPEMVQIGNEIASGLLWNGEYVTPVNNSTVGGDNTGYPWTGGSNSAGFDRLATLLSAGIRGARDGAPGQEPEIMIHHDQGSNWGATSYYFDRLIPRLQADGADFDIIGYSYYPIYHSGGITAVQTNLTNTVAAYGKPVAIVEAGFPFRNPTPQEQNLGFPVTEAGQQAYLQALVDALQGLTRDMGRGVFWWYAEARPTTGLNVWQNGRYGLFDQTGNLNDAVMVFEEFLPPPGDFNRDGYVDAGDYVRWRNSLGDANEANISWAGDGDGVSESDYELWRENYGTPPAGAGGLARRPGPPTVPEPASLVLFLFGVACLGSLRRTGSEKSLPQMMQVAADENAANR